MTKSVITAREADTVDQLMAEMTKRRFRHMPVVEKNRLNGLVSIGDLVKISRSRKSRWRRPQRGSTLPSLGCSSNTMQSGNETVDTVDVEATWQRLAARLGSQLIDVRTRAEWAYVGIPDLGPLGKRAVLVEWQTFPDQTVDPRFAERLASEFGALGVQLDDDLFFICRSGSRSLAAAKAMAAEGYRACHNVAGGFEGPLDNQRHRVGGWKAGPISRKR